METTSALCPSGVGLGRLSPCLLEIRRTNVRLHIEQQTNKKDIPKHHKIYIHLYISIFFITKIYPRFRVNFANWRNYERIRGKKLWNCENIDLKIQ